MSARHWIAARALGALTAVPAAAQTSSAAQVDDSTIKTRVETRLKNDATLKGDNIVVSVEKGVVTLSGAVHTDAEKDRAKQLAKVSGVTDVDSKLEVESKGPSTVDKAETKTKEAAKATKDATVKAGEKTKDAVATTGEVINDAWITSKISSDFVNEDTLKGSDINVDTKDHIVTLKGTVVSAAGKARAEDTAKKTSGVKRVVNTLTIGPKK
jgi:Predicted periplasmic or secreted lipoprotein